MVTEAARRRHKKIDEADMVDIAVFKTSVTPIVTVASDIKCSRHPSKLTPQELNLGERNTPVSIWDVRIPKGSDLLTDSAYKNILSTLRIYVTDSESGLVTTNHVVAYMGPQSEESSALFVCKDVGR
jgi:hypothetical protein